MEIYEILAKIVSICHVGIGLIAGILGGLYAGLKWRWAGNACLSLLITILLGPLVFGGCPLTQLENYLRSKYDPSSIKANGFIIDLLERYFSESTAAGLALLFQVALVFFGIALITAMIYRANNKYEEKLEKEGLLLGQD